VPASPPVVNAPEQGYVAGLPGRLRARVPARPRRRQLRLMMPSRTSFDGHEMGDDTHGYG